MVQGPTEENMMFRSGVQGEWRTSSDQGFVDFLITFDKNSGEGFHMVSLSSIKPARRLRVSIIVKLTRVIRLVNRGGDWSLGSVVERPG